MSILSLDKMVILFEVMHSNIMNILSLNKMMINVEVYKKYYY